MSRHMKGIALPALQRPMRAARNWWLRRLENHYLACADVEAQRAKEACQNVAYYQRRAVMARSLRGGDQ